VSGADMLSHSPLQGLGLLVLSEIGLTVAAVSRGARETFVIAVKYRLRERLGIPPGKRRLYIREQIETALIGQVGAGGRR